MMLNPAADGSDGPPLPIPDADAEDLLREAGGGVGVVLVTGHRGVKRSQKRGPITPNRGNKCNTRQGNTKKIQKNKPCCAEPWYWIACYQDASCFRSRRATSCQQPSPSLIMSLTRFAAPAFTRQWDVWGDMRPKREVPLHQTRKKWSWCQTKGHIDSRAPRATQS